jgi:hypothetical protein
LICRLTCGSARERYPNAQLNLIKLMPHVAYINVYDNSAEAATDGTVPDPVLVLEMENGQVISPAADDLEALKRAPEWSKSILEAALRAGPARLDLGTTNSAIGIWRDGRAKLIPNSLGAV